MSTITYKHVLDEHLHILVAQGNHEAFVELKKRYHKHADVLCARLLTQYPKTGIAKKELVGICDSHFPTIIRKYMSGMSSFYLFWEMCAKQEAMDFLVDFSYEAEGVFFSSTFSIDVDIEGKYGSLEFLHERDQNKDLKRKIFEARATLAKYDKFFTEVEKSLLNLAIAGYTVSDLEKTGIYSRSQLYLTFKTASEKMKKYLTLIKKNS